jgi:hypothetical protein
MLTPEIHSERGGPLIWMTTATRKGRRLALSPETGPSVTAG